MPYLGVFGLNFKKLLPYLNRYPRCFLKAKFLAKMKILISRTRNAFIWVFREAILKKRTIIFEISALEFVLLQSLMQK